MGSEIGSSMKTVGSKVSSAGTTITNVGKAFAPMSAAVVGVGTALVGTATKTAATTDNIDKMSQKLGISRTAYQEWDYILSQNGTSIDSLKTGMKTLTTTLDDVNTSGSTAGTAFERLGISYDDLKGKSSEEVFTETIAALQSCEDETERTTLATTLFGKAGVELAPLLNSGAESTEELRQRAHDLGLVLDDETIDAGVAMTDAMDTMKRSLATVGASIATEVMPYLTQFGYWVAGKMPMVKEKIKQVTDAWDRLSPSVQKVIGVVAAVTAAASPVLIMVGKFTSGVGGMITKLGGFITKLSAASSGTGALSTVLGALTGPVGIVIAAIAALIAIFVAAYKTNEDFRNTVNTAWAQIKETISGVIDAVKGLIQAFISVVKAAWDAWGDDIMNVVTTAFTFISNTINAVLKVIQAIIKTVTAIIKGDWSGAWNGMKEIVSSVWSLIKTVVSSGINVIKSVIQLGLNVIKTVFTTIWNAIKSLVTVVWNGIKSTITSVMNSIKATITSIWNAVKSVITSVLNGIKSIITSVWNAIKSLISSGMNGIKSTISSIWNSIKSTVSSVINGIKSVISSGFNAAKSTVSSVMNGIKSTMSGTWNGIKSTVSGAMSNVKSTISSGMNGAKSAASGALNGIKSAFSNTMNNAKSVVTSGISRIKGAFNFSWHLPKLSLPHISVSGGVAPFGIAGKGSLPRFSISWYKKAMEEPVMFSKPTIFDVNPLTGEAKGAGEAGDEVMLGKDTMLNMIKTAVAEENSSVMENLGNVLNRILNMLAQFLPEMKNMQVVLDDGTLVGRLTPAIDKELGRISGHKERGN